VAVELAEAIDAFRKTEKAYEAATARCDKFRSGSGTMDDPFQPTRPDLVEARKEAYKRRRDAQARLSRLWPRDCIVHYRRKLLYFQAGEIREFKEVVDIDQEV
jgi:hypothetical protein